MKLVLAISSFAGLCLADFKHMKTTFPHYWNDTFNQFSQFKAFDPTLVRQLNLDEIDGYGCWCYFNEDVGKGRSHPIDEVDALCRLLSQGYECAMHDSEEETGQVCTPWTQAYDSGMSIAAAETFDIVGDCETRNPDDVCAARSCMVESYFLLNMVQLVFSTLGSGESVVDNDLKHVNGFVIKENCPIQKSEASAKGCCGEYPDRFAYREADGNRSCCGSSTYNTRKFKCCPGEILKAKSINCPA